MLECEEKKPQGNCIFGFFYDKKDTHYIVTKTRRDKEIRALYLNGKLKVEGFQPPTPPVDLVALRKDAQAMAGGAFSVITSVVQEGVPYIIVPEAASLSFKCGPVLQTRLKELRQEMPAPPPSKRPRTGAGASGGPMTEAPNKIDADKILEVFTLVKTSMHTIGDPPVHVAIVRAARKTDGLIFHYVQNMSSARVTLPAKAHFCSSTKGRFFDRLNESQKGSLCSERLEWLWELSGSTMFAYSFGGSDDVIDIFPNMMDSARAVAGTQQLTVYGHNVAESAERSAMQKKRVIPHRRKTAEVVLQLDDTVDSQFSPDNLGDYLRPHELQDDGAFLTPAWRVRMTAGFYCNPLSLPV